MKIFLAILSVVILACIIYSKWPTNEDVWLSENIKNYDLKLRAKEYYKTSGKYLRISGKFENNDTLFEYVLYSQPFGLGPLKNKNPIKKITIGDGVTRTEDYYICIANKDSLFNDGQSFPISQNDHIIFKVLDSLIKKDNSLVGEYSKKYQSLLDYTKQIISKNDQGFFMQANADQ